MWYYQAKKDDSKVVAKLTELAEDLPTRGFDVYYNRIRTEGLVWNRKRVLRRRDHSSLQDKTPFQVYSLAA